MQSRSSFCCRLPLVREVQCTSGSSHQQEKVFLPTFSIAPVAPSSKRPFPEAFCVYSPAGGHKCDIITVQYCEDANGLPTTQTVAVKRSVGKQGVRQVSLFFTGP